MGSSRSDFAKLIGENIRYYRGRRRVGLEYLSNAASVHYSSLSHMEAGRRLPRVDALQRIAKALTVSIDTLCGELVNRPLDHEEELILTYFRACNEEAKHLITHITKRLSRP